MGITRWLFLYGLCYLTSSTLHFVKPYSQATLNSCNDAPTLR